MYREDISRRDVCQPRTRERPLSRPHTMRWRGLEPPRGINPTRPSTLRVYQFRHQRARAIVATPSVFPGLALRYAPLRELCEHAVAAALGVGASYADARVVVRRSQVVGTRNGRVERLDDQETEGIGVRVLVDGAWGFACDRRLDQEGAEAAARKAAAFAKAAPGGHSRELAALEPARGDFRTPFERDPFSVPIAKKVELCLRAEQALAYEDVKVTSASVRAQR